MDKVLTVTAFIVSLVGLSTQESFALPPGVKECHPIPVTNKVHYLIGYGSLINSESKNRTYPDTGLNIPVRVAGFKRTWTARGWSNSSLSTTYLGIDIDPESHLNGVIFSVPNVPWDDITVLRGNKSDNGSFPSEIELKNSEFWIYVTIPHLRQFPDEQYPIVQSYVDIFLGGCIQIEKKYGLQNYSQECVANTKGWEYPWVNDRVHPRRPWSFQSDASGIDKLISQNVPDHGSRTYVERIYVGRSASDGSGLRALTTFICTSAIAATVLR